MNTLDDILNKLSEIIETSIAKNDPIGIFTYVYWRTTEEIKKAITDGQFEDNERMEKFDIGFAKLFIDAYTKYNKMSPLVIPGKSQWSQEKTTP